MNRPDPSEDRSAAATAFRGRTSQITTGAGARRRPPIVNVSAVVHAMEMQDKPFHAMTVELLECVACHDFARLSQMCDDDFGIVDVTLNGGSLILRDRAAWEEWFTGLFAQLDTMQARTWSDITAYDAVRAGDMGYSVVEFDQTLVTDEQKLRFGVIATIIWKRVNGAWKESRYHGSLVRVEKV